MIYHVVTTPDCNLCCEYCCGKSFDEPKSNINFVSTPNFPNYKISDLAKFFSKDKDKPVSIIFYGGEPLMNISFIEKIMSSKQINKVVDNFLIQTNGVLLDKLQKKYVNKFHTILVSIDGGKEITNKNRGKGTYEKVVSNLKLIKKNGFKGELIARMTVEEPFGKSLGKSSIGSIEEPFGKSLGKSSIGSIEEPFGKSLGKSSIGSNFFENISFLIKNKDFCFSSIHWQLDANMWHDYNKRNFEKWSKKYNKDISKLVNLFLKEAKKGNLLRLYPFIGILNTLLFDNAYSLRCGSGIGNFTIQTDGKIIACPIMQGLKKNYLGEIKNTFPKNLPKKLIIKEPCVSCKDYELCGGRCLYSNLYPCWPKKGVKELCETIKYLLTEMKRIAPEIKELIDNNKIRKKDLEFLKYNCCEIIP